MEHVKIRLLNPVELTGACTLDEYKKSKVMIGIERIMYGICSGLGLGLGISIMVKSDLLLARGIGAAIMMFSLLLFAISRNDENDNN